MLKKLLLPKKSIPWLFFSAPFRIFDKLFCFCLFLIISLITPLSTQALKVGDLSVGAVIKLGEYKFIKINSNGLFVTINPYPKLTFQDFTSTQCNSLTTCNVGDNCSTNGSTVTLTDARDDKTYRVRKFADGNCWMIDNLAYGGSSTDGCSGKTYADVGYTSATTGRSVYGTWTGSLGTSSESFYGDCQDPKGMTCSVGTCSCDSNYCTNHNCGYYYSWQAAFQNSLAYYGNDYQFTEPVTGLCPTGWQLPTGTGDNSPLALHSAMGYIATSSTNSYGLRWSCSNGCASFWQTSNFNGLFYGNGGNSDFYCQGDRAWFWTSYQSSSIGAGRLTYNSIHVNLLSSDSKARATNIRCLFSP